MNVKIVMLGDTHVGKSCIIQRYAYDTFPNDINPTIGPAYIPKQIRFHESMLTVKIWDTAGQEKFRAINSSYYRSCDIAYIVWDVTNPASLDGAKYWIEQVRKEHSEQKYIICLVGNKTDDSSALTDELMLKHQEFCAQNNVQQFICISAKTGSNVVDSFTEALEGWYKIKTDKEEKPALIIKEVEIEGKGCC